MAQRVMAGWLLCVLRRLCLALVAGQAAFCCGPLPAEDGIRRRHRRGTQHRCTPTAHGPDTFDRDCNRYSLEIWNISLTTLEKSGKFVQESILLFYIQYFFIIVVQIHVQVYVLVLTLLLSLLVL